MSALICIRKCVCKLIWGNLYFSGQLESKFLWQRYRRNNLVILGVGFSDCLIYSRAVKLVRNNKQNYHASKNNLSLHR